jgi:flagella synthesis protein FlgN
VIAAGLQERRTAVIQEAELECRELRQVLTLLDEERQALVDNDPERVAAIAQHKLAHVRALELFTARRAALLGEAGYSADDAGMGQLVLDEGQGAGEVWLRLARTAAEARAANAINGNLIQLHLDDLQARLALFAVATGGVDLYDAAGRSRPTVAGGRSISCG